MHHTFNLPFIGVTGTPIDTPSISIEYHPVTEIVRIKTKLAGTFELSVEDFDMLYDLLQAKKKVKRLADILLTQDTKNVQNLLLEVDNAISLHYTSH